MSVTKVTLDGPRTGQSGDALNASLRSQERAGVRITEIDDVPRLKAAADVFQQIWGKRFDVGPPINADLLRALSHAGNYVAAAFDSDGVMQGALVGFLGAHDGEAHLHSHILGVLPNSQVRGAGFALKQHQRWWAIDRGYTSVQWTFDPLVRRNAYFNLTKLGGDIGDYHVNFYGVMDDIQNQQDESDRILLRWDLLSPRAQSAASGSAREPELKVNGTAPVHVLSADDHGKPLTRPFTSGREQLVLHVPDDIVKMRVETPELARHWRHALRDALLPALDAGYRCQGVTRRGDYVLGL